jgi:hypothetical protein
MYNWKIQSKALKSTSFLKTPKIQIIQKISRQCIFNTEKMMKNDSYVKDLINKLNFNLSDVVYSNLKAKFCK